MNFIYKIILILVFTYSEVLTQIFFTGDSLRINQLSYLSNYSKFFNIHNYSAKLASNYELYKFGIKLENHFTSTISETSIKNIRDDNSFDGVLNYKFNNLINSGLWLQSKIINDNRRVGISKFSNNDFRFFVSFSPLNSIKIIPFYGWKQEEQLENVEIGKSVGLLSEINNLLINQNTIDSRLKYINDDLDIRKTRILNSEIYFKNFFGEKFKLLSKVNFNRIGRDYYLNIDSATAKKFNVKYNLEYRIDNLFQLDNRIELIDLIPGNVFIFNSDVYYRTVDKNTRYKNLDILSKNLFDTKIAEFKLELGIETKFSLESFETENRIGYFERSEKHSVKRITSIPDFLLYQRLDEEQQKNNFSTRITLSSTNKLNIYKKDTIQFDITFSKLRYDTPPIESYFNPIDLVRDDRDELMYILKIELKKYFNPELSATILLESYNNHIVYIFKERSSNNSWNRVLRLGTDSYFDNNRLKTRNRFEVLANYTVYDFEDLVQNIRSFSYRQFGFIDSTLFYLSRKTFINGYYSVKLSEQGTLNWKAFSSYPIRFLQEQQTELKLGYYLSMQNIISFGGRMTYFGEYSFNGKEKILNYDVKSYGPLVEMMLFHREDFYFNLKLWIEYIRQTNLPLRRNINVNFNSLLAI